MENRKKKISMQQIADELGVTKVTVSKALNNKEGVGGQLKEKIFLKAEELGYILPSYGNRKVKKVGVIMNPKYLNSPFASAFYMGMYEKTLEELRKLSCIGVLFTPHMSSLENDFEAIIGDEMLDGIILLGILEREVYKRATEMEIPKVFVDIYDKEHKSDSVVSENIYSMYEMTKYLIRQGHKRIGFVGTTDATTSITDRYLGYLRALLEKELPVRQDWVLPDRAKTGEAIDVKLPEEMPTAFVCNCDETAFRFIRTLNEHGYKVPEDISIVSFDNDIYAELSEPKLTTVAVNAGEIGRIAAKRIVKSIHDFEQQGAVVPDGEVRRVTGKMVFRDSVKEICDKGDTP